MSNIIPLYRSMIRLAYKFPQYNYRMYALRRLRDGFREGRNLTGEEASTAYEAALRSRELLQRQTTIGQMYASADRLVIEGDRRN